MSKNEGQSLIEVLVVLVVATMMIVALITILLSSLKNAQFAQNQTKATKLAQDTVDKIRILRDNNGSDTLYVDLTSDCFNKLWDGGTFGCAINSTCYYKFKTSDGEALSKVDIASANDNLDDGFTRQIQVIPASGYEARLIVLISWTDSSGEHSSNIENILIKPDYNCIPST